MALLAKLVRMEAAFVLDPVAQERDHLSLA